MADVWTPLAAISAAVGTLVLIIAAVYAHLQICESKLSRKLGLLWAFHNQWREPVRVEFRRLMDRQVDLTTLSADESLLLAQDLDDLEFLAILV